MSVPNIGPELPAPDKTAQHGTLSNPAPVYLGEAPTDDVQAASARASAVSHRFGGMRYPLRRPPRQPDRSGSDAHD